MKFLGCLLGFFVAVVIWAFVVAKQFVAGTMDMLRGGKPRGRDNNNRTDYGNPDQAQDGNGQGGGLFDKEDRQYVEFEEVKDEEPSSDTTDTQPQ